MDLLCVEVEERRVFGTKRSRAHRDLNGKVNDLEIVTEIEI